MATKQSRTNTESTELPAAAKVPVALWAVAQDPGPIQRGGRYLAECSAHPAKMMPALARRIVETYSMPGQLVVDPMCGIGTTVVEADAAGRRCVGVELEGRWANLASRNLEHALGTDRRCLAEVRVGDARKLDEVLGDMAGTVDLICTSPPYACAVGNVDKTAWESGRSLREESSLNYSPDKANLGHARDGRYQEEMAAVYRACFAALRPGGFMVTVTKNLRQRGRCLDLASMTVELARAAGFTYRQHVVALLCAVRDSELAARPSFWQSLQTTKARQRGLPVHLVCHEDTLVFQHPGVAHV